MRAQFNSVKHAVKEAFRSESFEVCAGSLGSSFSTMGGTEQDGIHAGMSSEFELSQ